MRVQRSLLLDLIPCLPPKVVTRIPKAVLVVYFILTLPFYCLVTCFLLTFHSCLQQWIRSMACKRDKKRQQEETKDVIIQLTPKILAPRRGRSLSIGKPEIGNDTDAIPTVGAPKSTWKTTTDEQTQCSLFKLPFELRRQIFEEVVGGYMIHIFFVENYLPMAHSRCKSERYGKCGCEIFGKGQWRAYQPQTVKRRGALDHWGQCELLALSKTCRKIYSETIELLYSSNTFDFNSIVEVFRFSLTVLPERMRLVKDVRWKPTGIYNGVNHRYISGKFGHIKIGQGEDRLCKRTPWLHCRKPEECSCLSCWNPVENMSVEQQQFVIYTWILRSEDEIREAAERERQRALESPRSSGTFEE